MSSSHKQTLCKYWNSDISPVQSLTRANISTDRQTYGYDTVEYKNRQIDWQQYRKIDRQQDRQTDKKTNRRIDRQILVYKVDTYSNIRDRSTILPSVWASLNKVYMYGKNLYRSNRWLRTMRMKSSSQAAGSWS